MEATESPILVLTYYDELLRADSANAVGYHLVLFHIEAYSRSYRLSGNDAYLFFAAWIK